MLNMKRRVVTFYSSLNVAESGGLSCIFVIKRPPWFCVLVHSNSGKLYVEFVYSVCSLDHQLKLFERGWWSDGLSICWQVYISHIKFSWTFCKKIYIDLIAFKLLLPANTLIWLKSLLFNSRTSPILCLHLSVIMATGMLSFSRIYTNGGGGQKELLLL